MTRDKNILLSAWRHVQAIFIRLSGEWRPLLEPRIASEQIAAEMKMASIPTLSFFFLLAVASAIATFGLLANSAPAIIGAMIVAPLMTPIMGLSYGVVQLSWSQIMRSAITVALGVAVVIAISFLSAHFIEIKVAGTEMLSRAFPSLLDLGVAMAAGAAGAFSLSRESIRNSIAGVAISVSLVPPLAVTGIGLALGRKAAADVGLSFREIGLFAGGNDLAVGASVLFLTNLAAIVVVAGTVMTIQGYARWIRGIVGLAFAIMVSIVLMQPLSEELEKLRVKSMVLRLVKTLPVTHPHIFESTLRLDTLRVRTEDDVLHVRAEGTVARDKVEGLRARLDLFRQELTEKAGQPVFFELEAIAVDIVSIRSAPDLEQMKQVPDRKLDPGTGKEVAPDKQ
jgi:uncharacterized hydrophobic protein (TIGR00271 family)